MAGLNAGTPASTIFVGNLAYELTEQQLIDYFSQVGPVKNIRIVTERDTGKPRGFGFIEFYDIPTAESAIRNLNGSELMGRAMRIVFAEGGPPGSADFRPRREREDDRFGDDRGRRPPPRARLVGGDLAYHASHGMAALLGQPAQPGAPADATTVTLARKTRSELWEYLGQVKALVQQNPHQARAILVQNPQLTKALFQMEIVLGLVSNPLGDVAPKGVAPHDMLGPRGGAPAHSAGGAGPGGLPGPGPVQAPPMMGMLEAPPPMMQQQQQPVQYLPPQYQAAPELAPPGAPNGLAMAGAYPGAPGAPFPAQVLQQGPPGMAPPAYILAPGPPQPLQPAPYGAPQPAPAPMPVDPRARQGAPMAAPQPMPAPGGVMVPGPAPQQQQPLAAAPQQQQPQPGAQPTQPPGQGMTPEMQQVLLQQVMNLTPQQIELLPPQQKAQVLALQQQLRGQGHL